MAKSRSMKRNSSQVGPTFRLEADASRVGPNNVVEVDNSGDAVEAFERWEEEAEKRDKSFSPEADVVLSIAADGDDGPTQLAEAMIKDGMLRASTIEEWYDHVEDAAEWEQSAMYYAVEHRGGYDSIWDVWKHADQELRPMEGDTRAFAEDYVDSVGGLTEALGDRLTYYFDYEAFGRDVRSDEENAAYEPVSEAESELDDAKRELKDARAALKEAQASGDADDIETAEAEVEYAEGEVEEKQDEYDQRESDYDSVCNMSDRQIGENVIESIGSVEDALGPNAENYFDWDAYVRDLEQDVTEYEFGGSIWTILDV